MKITVGSMFAGIGGICLAFKQEGYEIVWANEFNSKACNTYRKNFGSSYLWENDIKKVIASEIPDFKILVAGFPCQSFSIAGKQKGFNDARGNLFFEIIRILEQKMPEVVLLENVENLMEHNKGNTLIKVHSELSRLGYIVKYKTMTGYEYGNLPQMRSRIFITCFLDERKAIKFKYPNKIDLNMGINDIIFRQEKQHNIYYYDANKSKKLSKYVKDRESIYRITDWGISKVQKNLCPTLTASMGTFRDRVPIVIDDYGIRKLTLRECLDFQGFPKEFYFPNNISIYDAYKQIGNSVCVPVVRRIAKSIKKIFDFGEDIWGVVKKI